MRRLAIALIPVLVACGSSQAGERASLPVERWSVGPEPMVSIGVVEGAPEYELYEVTGSLRLTDGRIVVANAGSRELLYFDARGHVLRKSGGRGGGPGEFTWLRRIYHGAGDSILALDWVADRVSVFAPTGDFVYSTTPGRVASAERPIDVWLFGPFLVLPNSIRASREAVQRTLRLLPRPAGPMPYRVVLPVPDGRLWIREAGGTGRTDGADRWVVVDSAARPIADVALPARFDLHEVAEGSVLGRWRDAQDVSYVRLYRLDMASENRAGGSAPPWLVAGTSWNADTAGQGDALRAMRAALRGMVMWQESYYADHGSYAEDAASLALELPQGVTIDILAGDRRSHLAVAAHTDVPVICGIAVGAATPVGWPEGVAVCGQSLPPAP